MSDHSYDSVTAAADTRSQRVKIRLLPTVESFSAGGMKDWHSISHD